ncbi:MAG TPA: DUF1761 domain-containing protein [Acidobacteriota bacterium]|nr:DUF1761 domain-containing protein [Acidobacteriota bacterium]
MVLDFSVNLVAVVVAAVVSFIIGFAWYSSALFGTRWMALSGIDAKKRNTKPMGLLMVGAFLTAFIISYALAIFVKSTSATGWMGGAAVGFLAWIGFVATIMLGGQFWEDEPFALYMINAGHYLVTFVVSGALVAAW